MESVTASLYIRRAFWLDQPMVWPQPPSLSSPGRCGFSCERFLILLYKILCKERNVRSTRSSKIREDDSTSSISARLTYSDYELQMMQAEKVLVNFEYAESKKVTWVSSKTRARSRLNNDQQSMRLPRKALTLPLLIVVLKYNSKISQNNRTSLVNVWSRGESELIFKATYQDITFGKLQWLKTKVTKVLIQIEHSSADSSQPLTKTVL